MSAQPTSFPCACWTIYPHPSPCVMQFSTLPSPACCTIIAQPLISICTYMFCTHAADIHLASSNSPACWRYPKPSPIGSFSCYVLQFSPAGCRISASTFDSQYQHSTLRINIRLSA
ncbi:hypothetical protein SLEP1_g56734 [Rubroshorea leprosula]|uniref:Uncharacterized protein n=1 Tax=Rubroshorea leprosula TaxID=152421 RepID=A0AAV5MJ67_9ROSI|nr:hypothetical protein SLEP1_g56734 [Rubroshorea leprosula]